MKPISTDSQKLIMALKRILKSKGIRYRDVAEKTGLSEASIKRVFSDGTFTLVRFDEVCQIAGISMAELTEFADLQKNKEFYQYSVEQENFFVKHPRVLALFDRIVESGEFQGSLNYLKLSKQEGVKAIRALEKLGLVEWISDRKVKLKVSKFIHWRENGPLRKKYLKLAQKEFLESSFDGEHEKFLFGIYEISDHTTKELIEKLKAAKVESHQISQVEKHAGVKTKSVGCMVAVRPWKFSLLH